jgi:hypothetical protein
MRVCVFSSRLYRTLVSLTLYCYVGDIELRRYGACLGMAVEGDLIVIARSKIPCLHG